MPTRYQLHRAYLRFDLLITSTAHLFLYQEAVCWRITSYLFWGVVDLLSGPDVPDPPPQCLCDFSFSFHLDFFPSLTSLRQMDPLFWNIGGLDHWCDDLLQERVGERMADGITFRVWLEYFNSAAVFFQLVCSLVASCDQRMRS